MKASIHSFLSFSTGMVAGLAVGMLFAPHKGTTTRNMIKHRANEGRDMASERFEDMKYRN